MKKGLILLLGTSIIASSALAQEPTQGDISQKVLDLERDIEEFRTEEIEPRYAVEGYYKQLTRLRKDAESHRYDRLSDKIIQLESKARRLKTGPAKTLIQDIERLKRDIINTLEQQAEELFSKEDFTGAKNKFEQSLDFNPFNDDHMNRLGNTYLRLRDKNNAIINFRQAIKESPNIGLYHHNLGYALAWGRPTHATKQQIDEAIQEVYKAIELDPKLDCAYNFLRGLLFDRSGKRVTREIMTLQEKWLDNCPTADGHMRMATSLRESNPVKAITHYKKAVKLAPHYAIGHYNYILTCRDAKRWEDMLEAAKGFEESGYSVTA